jgi:hypothetical protein
MLLWRGLVVNFLGYLTDVLICRHVQVEVRIDFVGNEYLCVGGI